MDDDIWQYIATDMVSARLKLSGGDKRFNLSIHKVTLLGLSYVAVHTNAVGTQWHSYFFRVAGLLVLQGKKGCMGWPTNAAPDDLEDAEF